MSSIRNTLAFALMLSCALVAPNVALSQRVANSARTDVPVTAVMLFSSGVGYFEHVGTVRGNSATELRFKTTQINDILKSLVLQDENGGKVSAITYASQDPLGKTLRSFQVDISANPSLADLLNQLRGARISVTHAGQRISGAILGVEHRQKLLPTAQPADVPVLNILSGGSIRSVELPTVTDLSLDDAELQAELAKALGALGQARDQDKKPVTISFVGNGDRRVRIGYVVETPVWKTSYRLLLGDKTSHIQGWAIVENQTETDWNNISLSLVSGRPVSFMMDLYQPLYQSRPLVTQALFAGLRPQLYDDGISDSIDRSARVDEPIPQNERDYSGKRIAGTAAAMRGVGNGPVAPSADSIALAPAPPMGLSRIDDKTFASSVQSVAAAAKMGELFQYSIPNVTLARHKSAMLPIVADSIGIERVSIYNASVLASNPLNGVRLKNITGKHLLQGPVTVLDNDRYAGDARIDNVPPGQERLLSYGIDLEMFIDNTKYAQQANIVSAKIAKGLLIVARKTISSQTYLADNKGDNDKTLVIEHPFRTGRKVVDSPKLVETTATLYRCQGTAAAHKTTPFTIKEEIVQSDAIVMLQTASPTLLLYSRGAEIPQAVRKEIENVAAMKQTINDLQAQSSASTQQISAITLEQSRLRENMKTVGQSSDYYKRLLTKMNEQESSIEKLQRDAQELDARRKVLQQQLESYLSGLNVG